MKQDVRISRAIAMAGICSRRKAESIVLNGNVMVNGVKINLLGHKVKHDDQILVNNIKIKLDLNRKTRLWRYYKTRGLITTTNDEKGRKNIFDDIAELDPRLKRLISVGRLDINSEGLLLLTDDGILAQNMMLPKFQFARKYYVRALGDIPRNIEKIAKNGIRISGIYYKPFKIFVEKQKQYAANKWYIVEIYEGKNREVRKIFEYFRLTVSKLVRIQFGDISIKGLPKGQIMEVKQEVVTKIKAKIKAKIEAENQNEIQNENQNEIKTKIK